MLAEAGGFPVEQITEIAKWGGGWTVAIILSWVVYRMDRRATDTAHSHAVAIDQCMKDRISDWKDISDTVKGQTIALNSLSAATELRTASSNALTEAAKLQTQAIERLVDIVDRAAKSNVQLREALVTKGGLRPEGQA